jgi:hypothetical protein
MESGTLHGYSRTLHGNTMQGADGHGEESMRCRSREGAAIGHVAVMQLASRSNGGRRTRRMMNNQQLVLIGLHAHFIVKERDSGGFTTLKSTSWKLSVLAPVSVLT